MTEYPYNFIQACEASKNGEGFMISEYGEKEYEEDKELLKLDYFTIYIAHGSDVFHVDSLYDSLYLIDIQEVTSMWRRRNIE